MSGISKSQVSRLCQEIDEHVQAFLDRPIEGSAWARSPSRTSRPAGALQADGCIFGSLDRRWGPDQAYVKVREAGRIVSLAVIIAVGVNTDGRREVLGVAIGSSEAEPLWKAFLRQLADPRPARAQTRHLGRAQGPQSGRGQGSARNLAEVSGARPQEPAGARAAKATASLGGHAQTIFAQQSAEAAHEQCNQITGALHARFHRLAESIDAACEDVLVYMTFPREHWVQIASSIPLERRNGEIKRRADVIGIFPNDRAVVRLVGALLLEQNDEWAVCRRYMSLETLAALSDDPILRLSAVAA